MRRHGKHSDPGLTARFRAPVASGRIVGRWRPALSTRLFGVVLAGVLLVVDTMGVTEGERTSDRIAGAVMLVVAPVAFWLTWLRPYLLLTDEQVVVQNALAAFVVPLDRVKRADPGGYGLLIQVRGRERPVIAMAVVKANISFFLRRAVRADEVADAITQAARQAADPPAV